jgi:[acyl-carrier-protein] S-malonyltransferase
MADALATVTLKAPAVPVVANVRAAPQTDTDEIKRLLVEQVTGTVRWRETMQWLAANGVTRVVEIGSGKVLAGLVKRSAPDIVASSVGTPAEVKALAAELNG